MQVEFFTGSDGDAYWRVTDSNGDEVNRSSEGFRQLGSAKNNLLIFHTLLSADLLALAQFRGGPKSELDSIQFYIDEAGKQRWRVVAGNGEIVGASHKGFKTFGEGKNNLLMTHSLISIYVATIAMEK